MSDTKHEYHLVYLHGDSPMEEVFHSEIAALGRACAVMRSRTNHDFCIRNETGRTIHPEGSLVKTARLFAGD